MRNDKEATSKSKRSSPPPGFGPRSAITPNYQSAMASDHASQPFVWTPHQPVMPPPYGPPFTATNPHGGAHGHAVLPLGSHLRRRVLPSSTAKRNAASPLGPHPHCMVVSSSSAPSNVPKPEMHVPKFEMPTKAEGCAPSGCLKKLNVVNGLKTSVANGSAANNVAGAGNVKLLSIKTEGLSNETIDDSTRVGQAWTSKDGKLPYAGGGAGSSMMMEFTPAASPVLTPGISTKLELTHSSPENSEPVSAIVPQSSQAMTPEEAQLQHEMELKLERRKQCNRESARRSRMKKQAELDRLNRQVTALTAENEALRREIKALEKGSKKLKVDIGNTEEEQKANANNANNNENEASANNATEKERKVQAENVVKVEECHMNDANDEGASSSMLTMDFLGVTEKSGSDEENSKKGW